MICLCHICWNEDYWIEWVHESYKKRILPAVKLMTELMLSHIYTCTLYWYKQRRIYNDHYGFLVRHAGECQPFRRRKIIDLLNKDFGPVVTSILLLMQPIFFLCKTISTYFIGQGLLVRNPSKLSIWFYHSIDSWKSVKLFLYEFNGNKA